MRKFLVSGLLGSAFLSLIAVCAVAGSYVPAVDTFNPWAFHLIKSSGSHAADSSSDAKALRVAADEAVAVAVAAASRAAALESATEEISAAWSAFGAELDLYLEVGPAASGHDLWNAVDWARRIRGIYDETGAIGLAEGSLRASLIDGRDRADSLYVELSQHFAERMMRWNYVPDDPSAAQMNAAWALRTDLDAPEWELPFRFRQSTNTGD